MADTPTPVVHLAPGQVTTLNNQTLVPNSADEKHPGVVVGQAHVVADEFFGKCLELLGPADAINLGKLGDLLDASGGQAPDFTLEAWVNPAGAQDRTSNLISVATDDGVSWALRASHREISFGWREWTDVRWNGAITQAKQLLYAHQWTHLLVTHTAGKLALYINGVLVPDDSRPIERDARGLPWPAAGQLILGGNPATSPDTRADLLTGEGNAAQPLAFSPDGERIVTQPMGTESSDKQADRKVIIFDTRAAREVQALEWQQEWRQAFISCAAFSPDGTSLATAHVGRNVIVWDVLKGTRVREFRSQNKHINSVSYSPDGKNILVYGEEVAEVWDADDDGSGHAFVTPTGAKLLSAVYSPDGRHVLTAYSDETALVWDAQTRTQLRSLRGHTDMVNTAVYSPDGRFILTGSNDKTAQIWDAQTGVKLRSLEGYADGVSPAEGYADGVYSAIYSPDGSFILTSGPYSTAQVWDAQTGVKLRSLEGHAVRVSSVAYSPDGHYIITIDGAAVLRIWDAQMGTLVDRVLNVHGAFFSPDSRLIAVTNPFGTGQLWDVQGHPAFEGKLAHVRLYKGVPFADEAAVRDHMGADFPLARLFNQPSPVAHWKLDQMIEQIGDSAILPDISGNGNRGYLQGNARLVIDEVFAKCLELPGPTDAINLGKLGDLLAASDGHAPDFTLEAWVNPQVPPGGYVPLASGASGKDVYWALNVGTTTQLRWSSTPNAKPTIATAKQPINPGQWSHVMLVRSQGSVALYVNGTLVVPPTYVPADDPTKLAEAALRLGTLEPLGEQYLAWEQPTLNVGSEEVLVATVSPDGQFVATAGADGKVRIWNTDGTLLTTSEPVGAPIATGAFSPDGSLFATGDDKKNVTIWEVPSGKKVRSFPAYDQARMWQPQMRDADLRSATDQPGSIHSLDYSPDGNSILTVCYFRDSREQTVEIAAWDASPGGSSPIFLLSKHEFVIFGARYSPDGLRVLIYGGNTLQVLDARTGATVKDFKDFTVPTIPLDLIASATYSPDGSSILVSYFFDRTMRVLRASDGSVDRSITRPEGVGDVVDSVVYSPDGRFILASGRFVLSKPVKAFVCSAVDGKLLLTLEGVTLNSSFSPDGRFIAAPGSLGTARLWKVLPPPMPFSGRLAEVRLYRGVPFADEQAVYDHLQGDIRKGEVGVIFPLDFSLHNDQEQPVLFLGDVPRNLHLRISNVGRQNIMLPAKGAAGSALGIFELRFRPGILAEPKSVSLIPGQGVSDAANWDLRYSSEPDGSVVFRLGRKVELGDADYLTPGGAIQLTLSGLRVDARGGARATRVQMRYHLYYGDTARTPLDGSRLHYLSVLQMSESEMQRTIADFETKLDTSQAILEGLQSKQLAILEIEHALKFGVASSPRVLTGALNTNKLELQLANFSATSDLVWSETSAATFTIHLYPNHPWGLLTAEDMQALNVDDVAMDLERRESGDWVVERHPNEGTITIKPKQGSTRRKLGPGEGVIVTLRDFLCRRSTGTAYLTVNYENIGFDLDRPTNGSLAVAVERGPLFAPASGGTVVDGALNLVGAPRLNLRAEPFIATSGVGDPHASITIDEKHLLGVTSQGDIVLNAKGGDAKIDATTLTATGEIKADGSGAPSGVFNDPARGRPGTITAKNGVFYDPDNGQPGNLVPEGAIIMWCGKVDAKNQPVRDDGTRLAGWWLCDGENKTPDLRDRFIVAAGHDYTPGKNAGSNKIKLELSDLPDHKHDVTDPGHTHSIPNVEVGTLDAYWTPGRKEHTNYLLVGQNGPPTTSSNSTGIKVENPIRQPGSKQTSIDIRPMYYALCFIMKKGDVTKPCQCRE